MVRIYVAKSKVIPIVIAFEYFFKRDGYKTSMMFLIPISTIANGIIVEKTTANTIPATIKNPFQNLLIFCCLLVSKSRSRG